MTGRSESGLIQTISGPLVVASGVMQVKLFDIVHVGEDELMGEVIEIRGDKAWIQVYEETSGLRVGEKVVSTNKPLSVTLGPGMITTFYDGIQRPLDRIAATIKSSFITRGVQVAPLDQHKKWQFEAKVEVGQEVQAGDVLGVVAETKLITHKIMVPVGVFGVVADIHSQELTVSDVAAVITTKSGEQINVGLSQTWPIRIPRPFKAKIAAKKPLYSGQRIIDTFFPIVKGGTAATPGPFGSGKTVTQQSLAKWSDAQVIIYVGCGERGNEMTDVLKEFPELTDPKSGRPLMERTILIANTSNMPIAAREASIYTGITMAEYYRDMGYDVALMADSTSRWAEALREISGRLEQMPGEEGYPAYLASRLAEFYERSGVVETLGAKSRQGSVTVIGAVSPPGGDLSEPVSQSSLRVAKVFWALDGSLAYARHYPAIHWLNSYSLYNSEVDTYNSQHLDPEFPKLRKKAIDILFKESALQEIIRIVGTESLSNLEKVTLDTARILREDYLQQNAFDDIDAFSSSQKQLLMLQAIIGFHESVLAAIQRDEDLDLQAILNSPIKQDLAKMKVTPEGQLVILQDLVKEIPNKVHQLGSKKGSNTATPLHQSVSHLEEFEEDL